MAYPSFIIAGVILFEEGKPLHYKDLTQKVINTGITKLGGVGAKTPENTLNRVLNQDHPDYFINNQDGTFSFCETIRKDKRFNLALKEYKNIP